MCISVTVSGLRRSQFENIHHIWKYYLLHIKTLKESTSVEL